MEVNYIPSKIEKFVQKIWEDNKLFYINNNTKKKKYYCLSMFPYPSGKLHIGHIRNYTLGDMIARYKRQDGYAVLNPIGWDSFGIPAENAAYNNNISPKQWTIKNIDCMRNQLKDLGFSFNWNRELATSDPNYYKWEQLLFIKLYKSKLIYKKKSFVNWDPIDKTVLANEQVIDGKGWRSNYPIERKKISQWYFSITRYANDLLYSLKSLKGWPTKVKGMQKNWINKKLGYKLTLNLNNTFLKINIFIEKLSLLSNISFILMSNEHYLTEYYFKINNKKKSLKNNKFNKLYVINPISKKKIPLILTDQEKDFSFLCKPGIPCNYNDDYKFAKSNNIINITCKIFNKIKKTILTSLFFKLLKNKITIKRYENFNIKDWCISRQRYWGAPIPIVYCTKCGIVTEVENKLPVTLSDIKTKNYKNLLLSKIKSFVLTKCPICKNIAERETDTFDTFLESSWYYMKFISYNSSMKSKDLNSWLPVTQYIGGIEHATLHLIYARFIHKVIKDFGIVRCNEPFENLLTQGMVLMHGSKMSKSKGNIIDQAVLIEKYGADALRLFVIFAAPPEQSFEWNENGIIGCKKFLDRIYNLVISLKKYTINNKFNYKIFNFTNKNINIINKFNNILEKIKFNINENKSFNVIIALLMTIYNLILELDFNIKEDIFIINKFTESLLIILSPISPHITHYLWSQILIKKTYISDEKFPSKIDNIYLNKNLFNLIVQINGKFKTIIKLYKSNDVNNILENFFKNNNVKNYISNVNIKKIIYREFKIINIII